MAEATSDLVQRNLKHLSSQVRKRRGWLASDPTQADPLVDDLNDLTAHRILARQHAEAFPDAQDALLQANRLVAFHGAVGPFTPADDAVRFVTATAHIAAIQAGAGQVAAGAQTASALTGWTALVPHLELPPLLLPRTAVWILSTTARGALASGDLGRANAYADAAVHRCEDAGLGADPVWAPLYAETLTLAADCRWAAGITSDAVAFGARAADAARLAAAPVLTAPTRATDALVERLLPPLIFAEVTLADRLAAIGDRHGAASRLRDLIALLESARAGLGPAGKAGIAQLRSESAHDLAGDQPTVPVPAPAAPVHWTNLSDAETLAASTRAPSTTPAADSAWEVPDLTHVSPIPPQPVVTTPRPDSITAATGPQTFEEPTPEPRPIPSAPEPEPVASAAEPQPVIDLISEPDLDSAAPVPGPAITGSEPQLAAEQTPQIVEPPAFSEAEPVVTAPDTQAVVEPEPEPEADGEAGPAPEPTAYVPVDTDIEPRPTADMVEPETTVETSVDVTAAPGVEADGRADPTEPEPSVDAAAESESAVAAEAAPVAERPAETEPVVQSEPAPAPAPTELTIEDIARQALEVWRVAAAAGDRQGTVAAASAAVEALRPLAAEHPGTWGPTLVDALERFGDAKFRAGDWWGSRAPKKEAKALARTLGLS